MDPYGIDLRIRVLAMCDAGKSNAEVSRIFSISAKTIYLWKKQRQERGTIKPITKYQKGHRRKINLDEFKEFVTANPSLPGYERAKKFNISTAALRNIKKIRYTRKKNFGLC